MLHLILLVCAASLRVSNANPCPLIDLGWNVYNGSIGNADGICEYKNVRFASPPTGQLRFAKPQYPPARTDPPSPTEKISCIRPSNFACVGSGSGGGPAAACDKSQCLPDQNDQSDEDCLFLDIYVPSSVFKSENSSLPVIVWFHGGGFITGSKRPLSSDTIDLYPGGNILNSISEPAIFVSGNYRLGAYGWLAGSYIEANAQPNAGLLDQRAILQFVQEKISDFGGNPSNVSVWGESAGASSILHHMVMPDNVDSETPLFSSAILLSPAYQWMWDRNGTLNENFDAFAELVASAAGCENPNMDCLRNVATSEHLRDANEKFLARTACSGILPVGPAVDGKLVTDLTPNLLASGKVMKLDSLVISHVETEVPATNSSTAPSFIPYRIRKNPNDPTFFEAFLEGFLPGPAYAPLRVRILAQYPSDAFGGDQVSRAASLIADSSFLCNTRNVAEAYVASTPTFAMTYSFLGRHGAATHAADLIPLFANPAGDFAALIKCLACSKLPQWVFGGLGNTIRNRLGAGMKSYFMSASLTTDPNVLAVGEAAKKSWKRAEVGPCKADKGETCVKNVMKPTFQLAGWSNVFVENAVEDEATSSAVCGFWAAAAKEIMDIEGDGVGRGGGHVDLAAEEEQEL